MKRQRFNNKLMACLIRSLLILSILTVVGCGGNSVALAPPPLDDPPALDSMTPDKNDKTGEAGFWMNRRDAEAERNFREGVRAVKRTWK